MVSKRKTLKRHSRFRAAQRFGLTPQEVDALTEQIRSGGLRPVFLQSDARRHYELPINGKSAIVVWDRNRKEIVTLMEKIDGTLEP